MKENKIKDDRLLTRAEVAEIFQVSPSTVTRWAEAGKLPVVKTLGGHRRYEARTVMEAAHNFIQQEELDKLEAVMQKTLIHVPTMYGDHHVLEVRRILLQMRGVEDVNASSCFHTVEITYNPEELDADAIKARLGETGYLEELSVPVETGVAASQEGKRNGDGFFRHTTAFEQTNQIVGFAQTVNLGGRPLWPCPGVGVINRAELE